MTHKVIIADDSKNIQKVVEIILDERECEIQSCSSEAQLFEQLEAQKADIVFLDFSLSENKDGYDLANILKNKNDVKVIILFGTFDAVDENKIEANKIEDYIFKPFDAEKFLNIFDKAILLSSTSKNIIEESVVEESVNELYNDPMDEIVSSLDANEEFPIDERQSEQDWGMDLPPMLDEKNKSINPGFESVGLDNELPQIIDTPLMDEPPPIAPMNESSAIAALPPVMDEGDLAIPGVAAAGVAVAASIPGVADIIKEKVPDLPPLIEEEVILPDMIETKTLPEIVPEVSSTIVSEETKLPSNDDLEYPGKLPSKLDDSIPELVPIETLNLEKTSEKIHLEKLDLKADEEKLSKLKKEILGELEDDLWDENTRTLSLTEINSNENTKDLQTNLVELKAEIKSELVEQLQTEIKTEIIEKLTLQFHNELEIEIRKEVLQKIRQEIPAIVKNFCADELVQEIWKIVPEISEKLISSELNEIRNSLD